jgi:hypothetical protein
MEAVKLAANNQPFEVVYYPRASTPEFCVKASAVRAAMRIQWCSGMRFKMPFETEDSSRISWFMGTIASVQVVDPIRWPNSPWRLLQVYFWVIIWRKCIFMFLWISLYALSINVQFYGHLWCFWLCNVNIHKNKLIVLKS